MMKTRNPTIERQQIKVSTSFEVEVLANLHVYTFIYKYCEKSAYYIILSPYIWNTKVLRFDGVISFETPPSLQSSLYLGALHDHLFSSILCVQIILAASVLFSLQCLSQFSLYFQLQHFMFSSSLVFCSSVSRNPFRRLEFCYDSCLLYPFEQIYSFFCFRRDY